MANDTLQIMQSMDMTLRYKGQLVREDGHVVGIKPNPLSRSVFYAQVLSNDSVTFCIRTDGKIVAHGVIPGLTYDGFDYLAGLLVDIDSGLFNRGKDTKL